VSNRIDSMRHDTPEYKYVPEWLAWPFDVQMSPDHHGNCEDYTTRIIERSDHLMVR
jgi:hypothetical protein